MTMIRSNRANGNVKDYQEDTQYLSKMMGWSFIHKTGAKKFPNNDVVDFGQQGQKCCSLSDEVFHSFNHEES